MTKIFFTVEEANRLLPTLIPILEALKEPMTKDDLIRTLKIPVSKFNATLSILEIKDLIRETMGMVNRNF